MCSGGSEVVTLPVQFEVSDDRFMSRLLQYQHNTSKSCQVSDSDFDSENNDSVSNAESDTEQIGVSESTGFDKQVPYSLNDSRGLDSDAVSQQAINLQILTQLGSISKHLDAIKNRKCKKSNDVTKLKSKSTKKTVMPQTLPPTQVSAQSLPDLNVLRNDAYIHAQVEQRLRNLVDDNRSGTKIKSLMGGSV